MNKSWDRYLISHACHPFFFSSNITGKLYQFKQIRVDTIALQYRSTATSQHCNTAALQYRSTATLQYRSTATLQYRSTATPQHCSTATHSFKHIELRTLSDQSCSAQLFFFSSNITGGLYSFKRIELRTLSDQSCSAQLFFLSSNITGGLYIWDRYLISHARLSFFSFLVILQVGYINSKRIELRPLSDQSCSEPFFFFSSNITGRLYQFKRRRVETVIWSVMLGTLFILF